MIEECLFNEYLNLLYFPEHGFKILKKPNNNNFELVYMTGLKEVARLHVR